MEDGDRSTICPNRQTDCRHIHEAAERGQVLVLQNRTWNAQQRRIEKVDLQHSSEIKEYIKS
ncbi:hypothetical protein KSP40_PGU004864 [Platanthera guangdongensis]|uniref:Uncharacterized protein n=1 Tax=Platanthera guangdongensis TaxID=2320717 RepID=A0ABR2ME11_9ASPA